MAFGLVHVQHNPGLGCQGRVNVLKPVSHILMYCGFTNPEFLRRLPYRGIVVYDVIGDGYRAFFNILLQNESPEDFFTSYAEIIRISTPVRISMELFLTPAGIPQDIPDKTFHISETIQPCHPIKVHQILKTVFISL